MRTEISYPLSHRSAATRLALAFVLWSAIWVIASDYIVKVMKALILGADVSFRRRDNWSDPKRN